MYGCGGNMIGVCHFVLWNSMCRKQRLCEIDNILCRAIQFFRSFESVQTETGLLSIATRCLCYYVLGNIHNALRFFLLPPFSSPRLFHGMIRIAGW